MFSGVMGRWRYPYNNSPERTFYHAYNCGITQGIITILSTLTSSLGDNFVLIKALASVYESKDAVVSLIFRGEEISRIFSNKNNGAMHFDFSPFGIKMGTPLDNCFCIDVISPTCGVSAYIQGYIT
jgi:hypothetical protein